jgi:hypothetical protein
LHEKGWPGWVQSWPGNRPVCRRFLARSCPYPQRGLNAQFLTQRRRERRATVGDNFRHLSMGLDLIEMIRPPSRPTRKPHHIVTSMDCRNIVISCAAGSAYSVTVEVSS